MDKNFNIKNLSTVQDFDLYLYLSAYSEGIHLPNKKERTKLWQDKFRQRQAVLESIIEKQGWSKACLYARQQFFNRLKENPGAIIKTYIRDVFSNSVGYSGFFEGYEGQIKRPFYTITILLTKFVTAIQNSFYSLGVLLLIPFLGVKRHLKKRLFKIPWHWFGGWLFCVYVILTSGIAFASGDRLHIVIVPIVLICLACLISDSYLSFPFSIHKPKRQSKKIEPSVRPLKF